MTTQSTLLLASTAFMLTLAAATPCTHADDRCRLAGTGLHVPAGSSAEHSVAGHINSDGFQDIVVMGSNWSMEVHLSTGVGEYAPPSGYVLPFSSPTSCVIGDIDGDGFGDVVVWYAQASRLTIHRGSAMGMHTHVSVTTGGPYHDIALGDMDADGDLDIVGSLSLAGKVEVLTNNGALAFTSVAVSCGATPAQLALGDIDSDGDLDVIATRSSGTAGGAVLFNDSAGALTYSAFPSSAQLRVARVSDIDSDGHLDVVALTTADSSTMSIFKGDGTGAFALASSVPAAWMNALLITDVNGDGHPDIACTGVPPGVPGSPIGGTMLNSGDGTFSPYVSLGSRELTSILYALYSSDINEDGFADLVVTRTTGDSVRVFFGTIDGFPAPPVIAGPATERSFAAGDFDGDGVIDFVHAKHPGGLFFYRGLGGGGVAPAVLIGGGVVPGNVPGIYAADIDIDDDLDLLIPWTGGTRVLRNNGLAEFTVAAVLPVGVHAETMRTCDLTGLGLQDVVSVSTQPDAVAVWKNTGNLTFPTLTYTPTIVDADLLQIVDVDGDGDLDVVTAKRNTNLVAVHRNNGVGVLSAAVLQPLPADYKLWAILLEDLNDDGTVDLLVAGPAPSLLEMRSDGAGGFSLFHAHAFIKSNGLLSLRASPDAPLRILSTYDSALTHVRRNQYGAFEEGPVESGGSKLYWPAVLDVNADGAMDIVAFTDFRQGIVVFQSECMELQSCSGDMDGNTVVNGADLGVLLTAWGGVPIGRPEVDLNSDGFVDGADLGLLLAAWGPCPR